MSVQDDQKNELILEGAKGSSGGGGGKKGGGGEERKNSLRSNAKARIAELLGEGEIEGIVGGLQGVYLDETPIQNADGTTNFEGVEFDQRVGLPDQSHINGLPLVETLYQVESQVKLSTGPVTRTIVESNIDAIRVIIRLPSLLIYDDEGGISGATVHYGIQVRAFGQGWNEPVSQLIENEKTSSAWQMAHRVEMPESPGGPVDIRVVSYTPDAEDDKVQTDIIWESYTTLIESKFTYPNSAYAFLEIDAQQFGSSIPARTYKVRGLKVQVPANYDPVERTYTGIWNGQFKTAWTNNPAWVFYDLITNDRYGLGEFVDETRIDKWSLYSIAQYCDELIPSGYKNSNGTDHYEPRFTYNGIINNREEAHSTLLNVTNAFRGMAYWALGQTYAVADMPADPIKLVSNSSVIEGKFSYSGTAKKARHSVALVTWNDMNDFGRPGVEVVIDPEALERFGWRERRVTKHGCYTRGEAHRFGKWLLDIEQNETETIQYTAGWDHAEVRPFDIIAVADAAKSFVRAGGRIESVTGTNITLDKEFIPANGETPYIKVTLPSGDIEEKAIIGWADDNKTAIIAGGFSQAIEPDTLYIVRSLQIEPRQYRVLTVKETEDATFEVTALFHDPTKYARIEQDLDLDPIIYSRPSAIVPPPTNLTATEYQYVENSTPRSRILLSWTPGNSFASRHSVTVSGPEGTAEYINLTAPTLDLKDTTVGTYKFTVRSFGIGNVPSSSAVLTYEATGWTGGELMRVVDLRTVEGNQIFESQNLTMLWRNIIPEGADLYKDNQVDIFKTDGTHLRTEYVSSPTYTYDFTRNRADSLFRGEDPYRTVRVDVRVRDKTGRESAVTSQIVSNVVPATPVPIVESGYNQAFVYWQNPDDPDFAGTLVWIGDTSDFTPVLTEAEVLDPGFFVTPLYDTLASEIVVPAFTEKWIRIGAYDTFGKTGINISSPIKIEPLSFTVDTIAPEKPTGLAITSALNDEGQALVEVTWDSNSEDDLAQYDLEVSLNNGNYVSIPTGASYYEFTVPPGTPIKARLRARDISYNGSFFTDVVEHTAAADTVAPADVANLNIKSSFKAIWLSWDENTEADLNRYEIFVSETTDDPAEEVEPSYVTGSNAFILSDLESGDTRYLWVRAVDTSGNKSNWSAMQTGKTVVIDIIDVNQEQLNLAMPVSELPEIDENTPQEVFLTTDNEIYRQYEDDWRLATDAVFVTGEILGSQIGADEITQTEIGNLSISTPKLRSNSVDARKIRANSIEAHHVKADIITADKIAADAITAKHVGADVITGDMIKANEITGNKLATSDLITKTAQVGTAVIDDANIVKLNASKLITGSILSGTIKVDGKQLQQIKEDGEDPAGFINSGSTTIDPGRIKISGDTTLADWRTGGDETRINGGVISANTIQANQLVAGMRNITTDGIEFDHSGNTLTWTAGVVTYVANNGSPTTQYISSGSTSFGGSTVYIYFSLGATQLYSTTSASTAFASNNIVIATYQGGANINADYGRTIIDGAKIKTGTVQAQQIAANAISAQNIQAGAISASHIASNSITTDKLVVSGVTTDKLAIGSSSVSQAYSTFPNLSLSGSWQTLGGFNFYMSHAGTILAAMSSAFGYPSGESGLTVQLVINGYSSFTTGGSGLRFDTSPSITFGASVSAGTHYIYARAYKTGTNPITCQGVTLTAVGAKR